MRAPNPISTMLAAMANDALVDAALEAGELVRAGGDDAVRTPDGAPDILVTSCACEGGSVLVVKTVLSDRFNGGFAIIGVEMDGRPVGPEMPPRIWSVLRPRLKADWAAIREGRRPEGLEPKPAAEAAAEEDWAQRLEAIGSGKTEGSKDALACQAGAEAIRMLGSLETVPETAELDPARRALCGLAAIASGVPAERGIELASHSHHLLDAVTADVDRPLLLSAAQRKLLGGMVLALGKRATGV
jgi:hypothetical protein